MRWRRDDRLQPDDDRADVRAEDWLKEFEPIRPDALTAADRDANRQPAPPPEQPGRGGRRRVSPELPGEQAARDSGRRGGRVRPGEQGGWSPPPVRQPRRDGPERGGFGRDGLGPGAGGWPGPPPGYRQRPAEPDPRDPRSGLRPEGYRQGQDRRERLPGGRVGYPPGPGVQRQPRDGFPARNPTSDGFRRERPLAGPGSRRGPEDGWRDRNGARGRDDRGRDDRGRDDRGGPVGVDDGRDQPGGRSRADRRSGPRGFDRAGRPGDYPTGRDARGGSHNYGFRPGGGAWPRELDPAGDGSGPSAGYRPGAAYGPVRPGSGFADRDWPGSSKPREARPPQPARPGRQLPMPGTRDAALPRSGDARTPQVPGEISTDNPDDVATFPLPVILPSRVIPPERIALPGAKRPRRPLPPEPVALPAGRPLPPEPVALPPGRPLPPEPVALPAEVLPGPPRPDGASSLPIANLPSATMLPRPGPIEAPRGFFEPARLVSTGNSVDPIDGNLDEPASPVSGTGSVAPPARDPNPELSAAATAKLDQIKDLYLTAEAIGEDALAKHFEQVSARQRELIRQFFDRSGGH